MDTETIINRIFNNYRISDISITVNLYSKDSFTNFISIDTDNNNFEVPIFLIYKLFNNIQIFNHNTVKNLFVFPINISNEEIELRSSSKLLESPIQSNGILLRKVNFKNTIYYINKGIICDEQLDPIFLCTYDTEYISSNKYILKYPKIYLHPKVFKNTKDTLNKYITSKIIPCALNGVRRYTLYNDILFRNRTVEDIDIIIKDRSDIFRTPVSPTLEMTNQQSINKFLEENIKDFCTKFV